MGWLWPFERGAPLVREKDMLAAEEKPYQLPPWSIRSGQSGVLHCSGVLALPVRCSVAMC